jgi:ABC-type oligopeptide transport system substrate-binding subunit
MRLHISGAGAAKPGAPYQPGMISGVRTVSDHSVKVSLSTADPYFHLMLAQSRDSIVAREEIAEDHFSWKTIPIGAGPYRVVAANPNGQAARLERVKEYGGFSSHPPESIELSSEPGAFIPDLVMGTFTNPEAARLQPRVIHLPAFIRGIYFNYQSELGRDLRFRKAVASAIDRPKLVSSQPYTSPTYEMVPSNLWGRLGLKPAPDLSAARQWVAEIFKGQSPRLIVPIPHLDPNSPENRWMLQLLMQLKNIGLNIQLNPNAAPVFRPEDTASPFFLLGYIPEIPDPFVLFRTFREGGPWVSRLTTSDREFESLLDTDLGVQSLDSQTELIQKLGARFQEQHYAVPLFEQPLVYWMNPERVESLGEEFQRHTLLFEKINLKPFEENK